MAPHQHHHQRATQHPESLARLIRVARRWHHHYAPTRHEQVAHSGKKNKRHRHEVSARSHCRGMTGTRASHTAARRQSDARRGQNSVTCRPADKSLRIPGAEQVQAGQQDEPQHLAPLIVRPLCRSGRGGARGARETGHAPVRAQHSMTLTARPPREVSLYFSCMSRPVSRMVLMTLSSETKCLPSPAKPCARRDRLDRAHCIALDAGICTTRRRSQVRPRCAPCRSRQHFRPAPRPPAQAQAAGSHRAGNADFPWQPLRRRIWRRFPCTGCRSRRRKQKVEHAFFSGALTEAGEVVRRRG